MAVFLDYIFRLAQWKMGRFFLQVDIVQQFKNIQSEMNQLAEEQLPTLEVDDVKSLALEGWYSIYSM